MRIYTRAGDLAFSTFTFPDGQPHFKLETYEREFGTATVEVAIKSPSDLFMLTLVTDVLRNNGYSDLSLDVRYLLGARMDRTIGWDQPFTLQSVARIINLCGFNKVRLLDVHSDVALKLIRNSSNALPYKVVQQVMATLGDVDIVCPDKGAQDRVVRLTDAGTGLTHKWIHYCYKIRDVATGRLSSFQVPTEGLKGRSLLILDDLCDGGATFIGLVKELRARGAAKINLFVTHGIFSKRLPLEGIDRVFTTDSYYTPSYETLFKSLTVIPISMEKL